MENVLQPRLNRMGYRGKMFILKRHCLLTPPQSGLTLAMPWVNAENLKEITLT